MKSIIYVLLLKDSKYYVGSTDNLCKRYKNHKDGNGCAWTRRYKPIRILEIFNCLTKWDEDNKTKEYMCKYGIENVRGGSYCQVELSREVENVIKIELLHASEKCFNCGANNHFIVNCPMIKSTNSKPKNIIIKSNKLLDNKPHNSYAIMCMCFGDNNTQCNFHRST